MTNDELIGSILKLVADELGGKVHHELCTTKYTQHEKFVIEFNHQTRSNEKDSQN
jgi:hypothetical protein